MSRQIIDIGVVGNDGTGDSIRDSFRKVNDNFRELYSSLGLGERLSFIGLEDSPDSYDGQTTNLGGGSVAVPIVTVNETETGLTFKRLVEGSGITIGYPAGTNQIVLSSAFSSISADPAPQLGGNLSAEYGGQQYRIQDLTTPISADEAANKGYTDTKISRAGTNSVDPSTGLINQSFGRMTGPLVLSRDPQPDDDEVYDGLVAATKRYVDNSAFGSVSNLYVSLSGEDDRVGVDKSLQGRALAYSYRTFEAALKRAEELVLESRFEIGPYKKVLTYNNGDDVCSLTSIESSPSSGAGFSAYALMSVDTIALQDVGTNYYVGDILTLSGGTIPSGGQQVRIEVLSTSATPGAIVTFKVISTGVYVDIPGASDVGTTVITRAGPVGGPTGSLATFNVTYKVNNVIINPNGGGTGYSLVSVRITGGGGTGAFGTAEVANGTIVAITVTDSGGGFTSVPTVEADLPRFAIYTAGQRTDFTGDVVTNTAEAYRGRDIREGLYIKGETSGALAQILAHTGELDNDGNELFDVDIKYGAFQLGEAISYGDITKNVQISVLVESGTYEENFPLKVPQNVAIIGDEFRRVIVKPRAGVSSSPWAFQKFRRDPLIDGLNVVTQPYGFHYLTDSTLPVFPKINNKGDSKSAATLLELNKSFIQEEVIAWINKQITDNLNTPESIWHGFEYNSKTCRRDVGYIVDAIVFDLKYGGYARTLSAGLKYFQNASGVKAITDQLDQTLAAIDLLESLAQSVIVNLEIIPVFSSWPQTIDNAYISESIAGDVITDLISALKSIITEDPDVNLPLKNDEMDVWLCNDANIVRAVTIQGQGGFAMVLDPEGQILAKSPYCQEAASFSKSKNAQVFAGGMFVDGFTGNLQFKHVSSTSSTRISVSHLERIPNLPASFIVGDIVHRVNYVRDYLFDPAGSTATFVLDETTPFSRDPGQQTCTITVGSTTTVNKIDHRLQVGSTIVFAGTLPTGLTAGKEYYVISAGYASNSFRITDVFGSETSVVTSGTGINVTYQRIYELLMPGNRSMLSNDYTQVNDLGYGVIATNGGLVEAVSMFTYYCHISYYSVNGGQIRSVGGSSAHGNYALVAEGSDPLEVPTPTDLYYDLSQKIVCYNRPGYSNIITGLIIYVTGYNVLPLNNSELEIDHGGVIYRYPVTSVSEVEGLVDNVARLNLTSDTTGNFDGLFKEVLDGTVLTIRQNAQIILTGDLVDVAVRPSTGLVLNESPEVYRVLQFEDYVDPNGPYDFRVVTDQVGTFVQFSVVIVDIIANECTTSKNHTLRLGDKFIPDVSQKGFTAGSTYYINSIPGYNKFTVSTTVGGQTVNLIAGSNLSISGVRSHLMKANYQLAFNSSGTLPGPLVADTTYYVLEEDLSDIRFKISLNKNGIAVVKSSDGSGSHVATPLGLTKATLRENYNYVDLTLWQPGEYVSTGAVCTISIGDPATITLLNHGFSIGDVVKFETTGKLPAGLSTEINFHIISDGFTSASFRVSSQPDSLAGRSAVITSGTQTGIHSVGLVKGRVGDTQLPVVPVSPAESLRVVGTKFVFLGVEYIISNYQNEVVTNQPYARITLNKPLQNSIVKYSSSYTIKTGVPIRSNNAQGDLTIRISLTRVTSHDLLEIGTGSYADTNYPNEIYGPPVNAVSEEKETQERDVGRVFFVTTDQFGNFRVGPYFRVDQGTGRVTFSAAIALSNLDGIGFKRGVPIAEFSTDSGFSDNATDTVPTENAARIYIERRLGLTHTGALVPEVQLIPPVSGGYLSLDGQLSMKADINMGTSLTHKIINLADPTSEYDAVNKRSLKLSNIQDFNLSGIEAGDFLVFTGTASNATNVSVLGDLSFTLNTVNHTLDLQLKNGVISNNEVSNSAGIVQSKLSLNSAGTRANASNITQADKGIVSFSSDQFNSDEGWITVKDNGLTKTKLEKISPKTVLGNSSALVSNLSEIGFGTIVNEGGAIKKSQFSGTGFLRRSSSSSNANDVDYSVIESSAAYTGISDNGKLINRDSSGGFSAEYININEVRLNNNIALDYEDTATGGYVRVNGYGNTGGIYLADGTLAGDKTTQYWNNSHIFKTQDGAQNAPITASQIRVTAITTGGNTTAGTITGRWTLTGTSPNESRLQATYSADLAEYYEGDQDYPVGTVLVFGGEKEVTISNKLADTRVAGVVSNTAAFVMYDACPGFKNLVALQGRVPVRVIGKIEKGDILVTSSVEGAAQAVGTEVRAGTIIGKALQSYNSTEVGTIEVAVGRT